MQLIQQISPKTEVKINNLKYRRQFLLSPKKCDQLNDWNHKEFGIYNLYAHPDVELTISGNTNMDIALIGYIIDPHHPVYTNSDIVNDILKSVNIDDVAKKLYGYGGRFVLIVKQNDDYVIFHDACGLKSVFYTKYRKDIYVASQPLLFKLLISLSEGSKYHSYYESTHVKTDIEHWIPSGSSLYDNVHHLVPNHYLRFSTFNQVRYWPNKKHQNLNFQDAVKKVSSLLNKTMIAADHRFKLALPLTAGWDSRVILSASKPISKDLYFYTLKYRFLTDTNNDIRIPREILTKMGFQHHIIDCRKTIDKSFSEIYEQNTDIPHLYDWGLIAHGMINDYPSERVTIKGNCAEIGRCFYYKTGTHKEILSEEDVVELIPPWKDIPFIKEQIFNWFNEVKDSKVNMGYDLFDLFYWEHRMGGWQAQNQLEWDIIQEAFTPFNNRELLETLLDVEAKYRCAPNYLLFTALIQELWKETLMAPINPISTQKRVKDAAAKVVKGVLKQTGIFYIVKEVVTRLKKRNANLKYKVD
jgi:hypothetical protein